jgi:hypothetical protein
MAWQWQIGARLLLHLNFPRSALSVLPSGAINRRALLLFCGFYYIDDFIAKQHHEFHKIFFIESAILIPLL